MKKCERMIDPFERIEEFSHMLIFAFAIFLSL